MVDARITVKKRPRLFALRGPPPPPRALALVAIVTVSVRGPIVWWGVGSDGSRERRTIERAVVANQWRRADSTRPVRCVGHRSRRAPPPSTTTAGRQGFMIVQP